MVLRGCVAILIVLGTYAGGALVERVFSPRTVAPVRSIDVSGIDPWTKMKQELQSRRRARSTQEELLRSAANARGYDVSGVPLAEVEPPRQ